MDFEDFLWDFLSINLVPSLHSTKNLTFLCLHYDKKMKENNPLIPKFSNLNYGNRYDHTLH